MNKLRFSLAVAFAVAVLALTYLSFKTPNKEERIPTGEASSQTENKESQKAQEKRVPSSMPSTKNLEEQLKVMTTEYTLQKSENGQVTSIFGKFKNRYSSISDAVSLAKDLAPNLVSGAVELKPASRQPAATLTSNFVYSQFAKGTPVYMGEMSVVTNSASGEVIMVNSALKPVTEVPSRIVFDQTAAWNQVKREYPNSGIEMISQKKNTVVFVPEPPQTGSTELAWIFRFSVKNPQPKSYEVAVGAESGRIVNSFLTTID